MFDARADTARNRLYITLDGYLTDDEIKEAAARTLSEARRLREGFDVVNDISTFKPASPEGAAMIGDVQKKVAGMGMNRVVRIASALARLQFDRGAKGAGYKGLSAGSVEEADQLLDAA